MEEEADEVVPDGVEEVELARINLEQKEREQKLILHDIRKLSLSCDTSGDLCQEKEGDLWIVASGKSTLVRKKLLSYHFILMLVFHDDNASLLVQVSVVFCIGRVVILLYPFLNVMLFILEVPNYKTLRVEGVDSHQSRGDCPWCSYSLGSQFFLNPAPDF